MAFSATNIYPVGGNPKEGNAPTLWMYWTADAAADVDTSGYFDNGTTTNTGMRSLMQVGDIVLRVTVNSVTAPTSVSSAGLHIVSSISAAGVIDVNDATAISTTDTD